MRALALALGIFSVSFAARADVGPASGYLTAEMERRGYTARWHRMVVNDW